MLIWILAAVLFVLAGACGYKLGAIRFGVSFIGLVLAAALALPLGPYLRPVVGLLGLKSPLWAVVLPPFIVFLIIYAIFIGLSFFVHRKVELHFKYNAEDTQRFGWERVNHGVGLWVGLMTGTVWLFLIGLVIYVAGYFTVQVSSDETSATPVRLLSQAREEMHTTGFDRAVAPFDPATPHYYQACDILGLIYQNPILIGRLSQYPPFLLLGDRPEVQDLARDTEFNQLLLTKADVLQILKHPKLQPILQSPELMQELETQDLTDLRTYLETGASPKYQDEKILGKWKLDPYATMAQERKRHPDLSSTQMRQLKKVMMEIMPDVSFTATTDNKAALKADVSEKLKQLYQPPPAPVRVQVPAPGALSPQYAQRYGTAGRAQAPVAQRLALPPTPKTNEIPYMVSSEQGNWHRDGDKYQLKMQDDKGKSQDLQLSADEERLVLYLPNTILVFAKAD